MDDRVFLDRFEAAAIPRDEWTHHCHVRMAFLYLRELPFDQALLRIRTGIQTLNRANQVPETPTGGYHETLTVAWARVIAARLREDGAAPDFDSFAAANPDLLDKNLLQYHYTRELMFSAEAKKAFVAPDLAPLPA